MKIVAIYIFMYCWTDVCDSTKTEKNGCNLLLHPKILDAFTSWAQERCWFIAEVYIICNLTVIESYSTIMKNFRVFQKTYNMDSIFFLKVKYIYEILRIIYISFNLNSNCSIYKKYIFQCKFHYYLSCHAI